MALKVQRSTLSAHSKSFLNADGFVCKKTTFQLPRLVTWTTAALKRESFYEPYYVLSFFLFQASSACSYFPCIWYPGLYFLRLLKSDVLIKKRALILVRFICKQIEIFTSPGVCYVRHKFSINSVTHE